MYSFIMPSIVFFHAHPDDEAIATGGTIAKMVAEGHQVTLVFATRGEVGEVPDGFLEPGMTLGEAREAEARKAAQILGVSQIEFLGYRDSGLKNELREDPDSPEFCRASQSEAAERLVKILDSVDADILTTYDPNGGYRHPDHIQVHQVGDLAAKAAKKEPQVFWATMNRDHFQKLLAENPELQAAMEDAPAGETTIPDDEPDEKAEPKKRGTGEEETEEEGLQKKMQENPDEEFGWPDSGITHTIDVVEYLDKKIASMQAHASQIGEDSFFISMSEETRKQAIGSEWFVQPGLTPGEKKIPDLTKQNPAG